MRVCFGIGIFDLVRLPLGPLTVSSGGGSPLCTVPPGRPNSGDNPPNRARFSQTAQDILQSQMFLAILAHSSLTRRPRL
jgi:hypothetical protein